VLHCEVGPRLELGKPSPHDQGYDIYEAPALIHAVAQTMGGQAFLCGGASEVQRFLDAARDLAEPRVIAFWLQQATFFADDAGLGLQGLARTWRSDSDPLKRYIAQHSEHLVDPDNL
jgi:hypothetical protein